MANRQKDKPPPAAIIHIQPIAINRDFLNPIGKHKHRPHLGRLLSKPLPPVFQRRHIFALYPALKPFAPRERTPAKNPPLQFHQHTPATLRIDHIVKRLDLLLTQHAPMRLIDPRKPHLLLSKPVFKCQLIFVLSVPWHSHVAIINRRTPPDASYLSHFPRSLLTKEGQVVV